MVVSQPVMFVVRYGLQLLILPAHYFFQTSGKLCLRTLRITFGEAQKHQAPSPKKLNHMYGPYFSSPHIPYDDKLKDIIQRFNYC